MEISRRIYHRTKSYMERMGFKFTFEHLFSKCSWQRAHKHKKPTNGFASFRGRPTTRGTAFSNKRFLRKIELGSVLTIYSRFSTFTGRLDTNFKIFTIHSSRFFCFRFFFSSQKFRSKSKELLRIELSYLSWLNALEIWKNR